MVVDRVAWKISVIGQPRSGKSALISRIVYDSYESSGQSKPMNKRRFTLENGSDKIMADILFQEISSQEDADRLLPSSTAILVTVDITNQSSIKYAEEVLKFTRNFERRPFVYVVATKLDLKYEAAIWVEELNRVCGRYGVQYQMTSAKTGEGVMEAIKAVTTALSERFYAKRNQTA
ncbi:MAG TPA: GTPase domain-containing protein [Thermoplasmataceae archaeon]|nr:GTPase domain-containing protein [Thermoplasmataceae archaeon]